MLRLSAGFSKWVKAHKKLSFLIIAAVAVVLFLFGAKIALFINFMLGNDIVVKLESDKAHIFVQRPSSEDVSLTAS